MITEQDKAKLCADWHRLYREMEKAQDADQPLVAANYERQVARIEERLYREGIDPRDYKP